MIANILDTSRLEAGGIELAPEPIDLGEVVASVIEELEAQAEELAVRLETRVPRAMRLDLDVEALRTVLRNLLDNAIKSSGAAGGGVVTVEAAASERGIELRVRDSGIGFAKEENGRLFGRFYRPGDEMRRRMAGSGLGLYIVRRYVELEHGTVSAHSDGPGRGATFTVSWPSAKGASS
jgi:signal transduction histidine kinase